jgi:MFS family permease
MLGNAIGEIAIAFAVLDLTGSKADLGYVLAARSVPVVVFLLLGGVLSDRLPRHHVLVGSSVVSCGTQLAVGALLLSGNARVWELGVFAAVNGTSAAFFFPASTGVVPQTVPGPVLQQANALLRLGLNSTTIVGAALGGVLVAATDPGTAIVIDGVTFAVSALFIGLMRLRPGERVPGSTMLQELRIGWTEFRSRTWLWAIVAQFSLVNAAEQGSVDVLGPAISKTHFGGAAWWGAALTAQSLGLVVCGTMMLRYRPQRILRTATLAIFPLALFPLALVGPVAAPLVVLAGFVAGFFVEIFGVLWDTAMQQEVPGDRLSRVSAYDALGSFVFVPIGLAAAGPIAEAAGTRPTLLGAAALIVVPTALVLSSREVRTLSRA